MTDLNNSIENNQQKIYDKLDYFYKTNKIPHLIFHGESGSGKTVLSRASMGLLTMSTAHRTGTVVFDGQDLSTASREAVRDTWGTGMAMIFQDPMTSLNPVYSIQNQMVEIIQRHMHISEEQARQEASVLGFERASQTPR